MRILRKIAAVLLCLTLFTLTACGGASKAPSPTEIVGSIKELSGTAIDWVELDKAQISSYLGITEDMIIEGLAVTNNSEEHVDLIAAVRIADEQSRQEVLSGATALQSNTASTFRTANENEYNKIISAVIAETDDIIIFCIMDNYSKVETYLEDIGAKIITK